MDFDLNWLRDPQVFAVNRLPAHAALSVTDSAGNPFSVCLDGTWRFCYAETPQQAPAGFAARDFDTAAWDEIAVPGLIQLQGDGKYGAPHYVNTMYPWDGHENIKPGEIPQDYNPVGCYVRSFTVPETWGADAPVRIRFDGVDAAMAVWCNGAFIGYSEDSFTPAEFDLTPAVDRAGENKLAVQVFRFCSGSWLEDQDFWRFSGIFRSVILYTIPSTHLADAEILATLNDDFTVGTVTVNARIEGDFWGTLRLELGGTPIDAPIFGQKATLAATLQAPLLWSAEQPNLYAGKLMILDDAGSVLEQAPVQIGFRRFECKDGLMLLNGKRIVFKGVNRHEWNCRTGRVISYDDMAADIINMKRHNINAVRTSHYPNHPALYELCNLYGLYVIDETNLESHGTWQRLGVVSCDERMVPGDKPEWLEAVLERAKSMLERDKNYPCILMWSCGNESGGGKNLHIMSDYFRSRDASRLVHYEGIFHDRRCADTSDVESQMYPSVQAIEAFLAEHPEKPFICCEYAHAMGNSCGALHKYTELALREPRYQGGFIWDYIDQGLLARTPEGTEYFAYGGDFGDQPTDYNFCENGLVYPNRVNSPKMREVKACYADYTITVTEKDFTIANHALFTNTSEYLLVAELRTNGRMTGQRKARCRIAPGQSGTAPLPFAIPDEPGEYTVTIRLTLAAATLWAPEGHSVACGQGVFFRAGAPRACSLPVSLVNGDVNIGAHGEGFHVLFSRSAGGLCSYRRHGQELLQTIPQLSFWRAPTDNDRGCKMPAEYAAWKTAGLYAQLTDVSAQTANGAVEICATYKLPTPAGETIAARYIITGDGRVETILAYHGETAICVPEFGVQFVLPAQYSQVAYYGMGPAENYADRRHGALLGQYAFDAAHNMEPYSIPQECGNRTGVRRACVVNKTGQGLYFECEGTNAFGERGMDFSALPYTPHEVEAARHAYALPPITKTVVRCTWGQMGVGGDNSWGAKPHDEYLVRLKPGDEFRFAFGGI